MPLIDRLAELTELRRLRQAPPSLIILQGRRRVGKSFLLSEAFSDPRVISYQADEQPEPVQLEGLARETARLLPGKPSLHFGSWDEALRLVRDLAEAEPLVLILDEFQYLAASVAALPSILQRHWDQWQRESVHVVLVLCGSSLTFMEGLLSSGAPLFGRATYRPVLQPLDCRDAAQFIGPSTKPVQAIERYGILGGTPQYQVWAGARSVERTIRDVILTKGAPLYDEPLQLVRGEESIRDPRRYFAALAAIAGGRTRTGEIGAAIGDPSNVSHLLDRLTTLRYIEQVVPVAFGSNRSRAYWRIVDPYFRFWFRRVYPNRSRLDRGRVDDVMAEIRDDLDTYMGAIFEDCCRVWLSQYSGLESASRSRDIGSWWSRRGDAEIDVVAADTHHYTLLGSCKWRNRLVDVDVLRDLHAARALLGREGSDAQLAVFAKTGFTAQLEARAARENIVLVTAADLITSGRDQPLRRHGVCAVVAELPN